MYNQEKQPHTNGVHDISPETRDTSVSTTNEVDPSYPPQDSGKGAWIFLFGACIIEITAWGIYNFCQTQADTPD